MLICVKWIVSITGGAEVVFIAYNLRDKNLENKY